MNYSVKRHSWLWCQFSSRWYRQSRVQRRRNSWCICLVCTCSQSILPPPTPLLQDLWLNSVCTFLPCSICAFYSLFCSRAMTTAPHGLLMVGLIAFYQPSCLHVDSGRRSLSVQAHGVWRLNDFRILLVTRQESKIPGTRSAFQVSFACFFLSSYHPPRILSFPSLPSFW